MDVNQAMFAMEVDVKKWVILFAIQCVKNITRVTTVTVITSPAGHRVEMAKDALMADAKTFLVDRDVELDLFVMRGNAKEIAVANVPRPVPRDTDVMTVTVTC